MKTVGGGIRVVQQLLIKYLEVVCVFCCSVKKIKKSPLSLTSLKGGGGCFYALLIRSMIPRYFPFFCCFINIYSVKNAKIGGVTTWEERKK